MDKQLITLKLESLRRCLNRVADKTPKDFAQQVMTYADQNHSE